MNSASNHPESELITHQHLPNFEDVSAQDDDQESLSDIAAVGQEAIRWRKRKRRTLAFAAIAITMAVISVATLFIDVLPQVGITWVFGIACVLFLGGLVGILAGTIMRPLRRNPIHKMWSSNDPAAVGPLLEATQMMMPNVKVRAVESMAELLPRMTEKDALKLSHFQRDCLVRMLGTGLVERPEMPFNSVTGSHGLEIGFAQPQVFEGIDRTQEITIAILRILGWCGGEKEIQAVERFIERSNIAANNKETMNAAILCVDCINERLSNNSYLRPSDPIEADTDALLRPSDRNTMPTDQLLRPNAQDAESVASVVN